MFGPTITATFDLGKGDGPTEIELGPIKNEQDAAERFTSWINDNRVRIFLARPNPCTVSAEQEWIRKKNTEPNSVNWAIYAKGSLIGNIELMEIDRSRRCAELGIVIGEKLWWSRGIATVAETLVFEYAFNNIVAGGLNKITARAVLGNEGSLNVLKKVGFCEVGILRQNHWAQGRWYDLWLGELLKEDWSGIREEKLSAAGITTHDLYPGCEDLASDVD